MHLCEVVVSKYCAGAADSTYQHLPLSDPSDKHFDIYPESDVASTWKHQFVNALMVWQIGTTYVVMVFEYLLNKVWCKL